MFEKGKIETLSQLFKGRPSVTGEPLKPNSHTSKTRGIFKKKKKDDRLNGRA
jgi:hypothetical protein